MYNSTTGHAPPSLQVKQLLIKQHSGSSRVFTPWLRLPCLLVCVFCHLCSPARPAGWTRPACARHWHPHRHGSSTQSDTRPGSDGDGNTFGGSLSFVRHHGVMASRSESVQIPLTVPGYTTSLCLFERNTKTKEVSWECSVASSRGPAPLTDLSGSRGVSRFSYFPF